ncbi:MAG: hypothetical protein GY759_05400, partial [Chloroflexi bacterium]|nr:hypothetical protein [Chloroflexota bacterium]
IRQLGTPAKPPKPRGISPGRRKGMKLPKRLHAKKWSSKAGKAPKWPDFGSIIQL